MYYGSYNTVIIVQLYILLGTRIKKVKDFLLGIEHVQVIDDNVFVSAYMRAKG